MSLEVISGEAQPIGPDLLEGASEIAAYTGLSERQIFYLVRTQELPGVFKIGRKLFGIRSEISAALRARAKGASK